MKAEDSSQHDTNPGADSNSELQVELVAQALDALETGGPEAVDELCSRHPEHAATIRRRIALLEESALRSDPPAEDNTELPEELGDFRLLRPIGGGGMGVVWLAEERSLGREVALKIIRPDRLLFPGSRERFQREVETIAQLSHPGIVPVYSVGEQNGMPFFAMEPVRGMSLDTALDAVAKTQPAELTGAHLVKALPVEADGTTELPPSPLFDGSWPVVCTRIVREAAEALEYARRRGVLHRDMKPSNVMVTRSGRVLLLDFGLSIRDGDARITQTGSAVGSLAYMAPELHAGANVDEDARQDVYSLGVTLYELLAGRLPFQAKNEVELLRATLDRKVTPLRQVRPDISWELATIVEVAMDPEPERRYATAGAMARDLANALERRPIDGRPPSAALRFRRWIQRHPARAALIGALLIGPSVLLAREIQNRRVVEAKSLEVGQANVELGAANAKLQDALDEARAQRRVAQESFAKALEAVDRMLLRVGEHRLAGVPRMEGIRSELVADALDLYGWFLRQDGAGRGLRHQVVDVALTASHLNGQLAELEEAEAALAGAEALLGSLLEENPADLRARISLAKLHTRRARIQRVASRPDAAIESAEQAIGLFSEPGSEPIDPAVRARLEADAWTELSLAQEGAGETPAARSSMERAITLLEGNTGEGLEGRRVRYDLARNLDHLARLVADEAARTAGTEDGEPFRFALERSERAVTMLRDLVVDEGSMPEPRFRLARSLLNVGYLNFQLGYAAEGWAATTEAAEVLDQLFRDYPSVPVYGSDLASTQVNLAAYHGQRGDRAQARIHVERAIATYAALHTLTTEDPKIHMGHATALVNLAGLQQVAGQLDSSYSSLSEAHTEIRLARELAPDDEQVVRYALTIQYRLSEVSTLRRDWLAAVESVNEMLAGEPGPDEMDAWKAIVGLSLAGAEGAELTAAGELAGRRLALLVAEGGIAEEVLLEDSTLLGFLERESFGLAFEEELAKH